MFIRSNAAHGNCNGTSSLDLDQETGGTVTGKVADGTSRVGGNRKAERFIGNDNLRNLESSQKIAGTAWPLHNRSRQLIFSSAEVV